jgi:hypothetical protein
MTTKLLPGHTYRITFTKTRPVQEWESATSVHTVTVNDPRATRMWINRWISHGTNTVEIEEAN